MRQRYQDQLPLTAPFIDHEHGRELAAISEILDDNPGIPALIEVDLLRGGVDGTVGRPGLSADQVLRILIVKQLNGFSYADLSFHLADSTCYRAFCRLGAMDRPPSASTLQENIARIRPETLEKVNRLVLRQAKDDGVENGRKVRVDCTVVESDIREPTDSGLLFDCVRALTVQMEKIAEEFPEFSLPFRDHTRRAKRRFHGIRNAKKADTRIKLYRDLLKVTRKTLGYARRSSALLSEIGVADERFLQVLRRETPLDDTIRLTEKVISQTERRILNNETVPAEEKVVSIFEPHTDIIVKDRRDTYFGHKICLTAGPSSLILDCVIEDGNPADSTLAVRAIERQIEVYSRPPRQVAFDGGFASKKNLAEIKNMGVKDVAFNKRRGIDIPDMVKSSWVYGRLKRFRAGIEGVISFLKRCFGLVRCTWKGLPAFKTYVWSSVVSANLLLLARHRIA